MIQNQAALQGRLNFLWILFWLAGAVLGLRLVQLQILENVEYKRAAERNRSQMIYQTAPRGRIYDRSGIPLATNIPAFSLIYMPGKHKENVDLRPLAEELAKELKQDPNELYKKLQDAQKDEVAARLAENLPQQTMFRLSELKTIYPGVDLIVEARRYYPFGPFASHLIGYMGKIDEHTWKDLKNKGYRPDARIGRLGLEGKFESELRGRDGGIRMEVDAQGRLKRVLERIEWQAGSNIHLTIDAPTQRAADEAMRTSITGKGAIVAIDPRNGNILALVSAPSFDPNALLSSDPDVVKKQIAGLPEFNYAISGTYPPGSTFKPIVSAAGLNEGKIGPDDTVFCPGYFMLGNKRFLCWDHKGHKTVSFLMGMAKSCDVYFYKMGLKMKSDVIEQYAREFGLGARTGIALSGEKQGHMFGPETRASVNRPWYEGDTVNLSIGQGELLVTPIQMASVAATLANRGTIWRPHYAQKIEYNEGRPEYVQKPERAGTVKLKDSTWDLIHHAMALVVTDGTAHQAQLPGLIVSGKTGTAQNPAGKDHAWFIAWANKPGEESEIALAVLVMNGGHGSDVAVPVAHKVLAAYYRIDEKKPRPVKASPAGVPVLPARPAAPPVRTF
jgi:penicillin-binding protein 2